MKVDRDFEALLREALGSRGDPAPFSVDVRDRVMARVAAIGMPSRAEMGPRQFGRWAAAASMAGAALLAAAAWQGPSVVGVVSNLVHTLAGTAGAALKLSTPAELLAGTVGRVVMALAASAQSVAQPLKPLQPLAQATLAATVAAMLAVTAFVLGRDLSGRTAEKEQA